MRACFLFSETPNPAPSPSTTSLPNPWPNRIGSLKRNSEINFKKADKGTTTVIMDTTQKIEEGLQQLSDDKFYKPLGTPIVLNTALKVNRIVDKLFRSGNIDTMTHKD